MYIVINHGYSAEVTTCGSICSSVLHRRRGLFLFRNRSLLFWTVDVSTGNQAFIRDRCIIFPGLSYNKENNT